MNQVAITKAIGEILQEDDPTIKALKLASLCSSVFLERGIELVVVGGSAIEILTEGAYTSGDIHLCTTSSAVLPLRQRQELMGTLGAQGGPRSRQVAGLYVDLLGQIETSARTPLRRVDAPFGEVRLIQPEELLAERILISVYPQAHPPAERCARILTATALQGHVGMDWDELRRIAALPAYAILPQCENLVKDVARELGIRNPFDPN